MLSGAIAVATLLGRGGNSGRFQRACLLKLDDSCTCICVGCSSDSSTSLEEVHTEKMRLKSTDYVTDLTTNRLIVSVCHNVLVYIPPARILLPQERRMDEHH